MLLNDLDSAVESFKKALELEPNDGSCLFKFVECLFHSCFSSCHASFVKNGYLKSMDLLSRNEHPGFLITLFGLRRIFSFRTLFYSYQG